MIQSDLLYKSADILVSAGDFGLARGIYFKLVERGEETSQNLEKIGDTYVFEEKTIQAIKAFSDSIAYQARLPTFQKLAQVFLRLGQDQEAVKIMERALKLKEIGKSELFELHKACANTYTRLSQNEKAKGHYAQALSIKPLASEIRSNLGVIYLKMGEIQESKRYFQDAIASNPDLSAALIGLASCLYEEGARQDAYDLLIQALEKDPKNSTGIFLLVKCAYDLKKFSRATEKLESYIDKSPLSADLLYSLAGLQYQLGRFDQCDLALNRALQIEKNHRGALGLRKKIEPYLNKEARIASAKV